MKFCFPILFFIPLSKVNGLKWMSALVPKSGNPMENLKWLVGKEESGRKEQIKEAVIYCISWFILLVRKGECRQSSCVSLGTHEEWWSIRACASGSTLMNCECLRAGPSRKSCFSPRWEPRMESSKFSPLLHCCGDRFRSVQASVFVAILMPSGVLKFIISIIIYFISIIIILFIILFIILIVRCLDSSVG